MIKQLERTHIIGDRWLYYKLYTGPKTSDLLLTEFIKPLTEELFEDKIIDQWFFIRYYDPNYHLRIRFHCSDPKGFAEVISRLNLPLRKYSELNLIWKIQLDNYQRELERYGRKNIKMSEKIFHFDSKMMVGLFDLIVGEEGEEIRWLFGLRAIDDFLSCFEISIDKRKDLLESLKIGYGDEFGMNRQLKKQLDYKYRKYSSKINEFISQPKLTNPKYLPLMNLLECRSQEISEIAGNLLRLNNENTSLNSLLSSFIHMSMNRLFKSKARLHEMVCYDFLFRYYKSKLARIKYTPNIKKI